MPAIEVNGETLAYERHGSGPTLLLIHSLGTGIWMWRDQIELWSRSFDVLAFDARGHGRSSHNGSVSVPAIAADLAEALKALEIDRVHVVAISMGGPITAHLYALAADRVSSVVIADSFARQGAAGAERVKALEATLESTSLHDYAVSYASGTLHAATSSDVRAGLVASIEQMTKAAYLETARSVFTSDVADLMCDIRVPVHIVVGEDDTRTPPALSEDIASLVPGATLERIAHAAHLANLDNPVGFHAAVDSFLAAHAVASHS